MNRITVEGIIAYGHHGCMDEEAAIGQAYEVDVYMDTDFSDAAEQDDLNKTVDYVDVNRIVQEEIARRSKLIERVTLLIAQRVKQLRGVEHVEVRVCKPSPPIGSEVRKVCTHVTL